VLPEVFRAVSGFGFDRALVRAGSAMVSRQFENNYCSLRNIVNAIFREKKPRKHLLLEAYLV
jgi:hypothetical protein